MALKRFRCPGCTRRLSVPVVMTAADGQVRRLGQLQFLSRSGCQQDVAKSEQDPLVYGPQARRPRRGPVAGREDARQRQPRRDAPAPGTSKQRTSETSESVHRTQRHTSRASRLRPGRQDGRLRRPGAGPCDSGTRSPAMPGRDDRPRREVGASDQRFSATGDMMATGSEDATIRFWDRTGKLVQTCKGESAPVKCPRVFAVRRSALHVSTATPDPGSVSGRHRTARWCRSDKTEHAGAFAVSSLPRRHGRRFAAGKTTAGPRLTIWDRRASGPDHADLPHPGTGAGVNGHRCAADALQTLVVTGEQRQDVPCLGSIRARTKVMASGSTCRLESSRLAPPPSFEVGLTSRNASNVHIGRVDRLGRLRASVSPRRFT